MDSMDTVAEQNRNVGLGGFSLTELRLTQDYASMIGVKKVLTTIPVRKPNRQEFVRVHQEESYQLSTAVIEIKDDRETFLVSPHLWNELPGETIAKVFLTAMNRQGVLFLWPIRLPEPDGRHDQWNRSAMEAAELSKKKWIKTVANMSLGGYEVYEATGELPEPEWPELEFDEIMKIAFKDRFIESLDHPVIKRLNGEI